MYVNVTKVGQSHPKLLLVQRLHWTYQLAKYNLVLYCFTISFIFVLCYHLCMVNKDD